MNDLVGGHVDFFCEQAVSVASQINGGTIKAYRGVVAASACRRCRTCRPPRSQGVDYQMSIWAGIFAPKGTPKEVVDRLAAALDKALDDPEVQKRLAELGGSIPGKDERVARQVRQLREGGDRALVADSQGRQSCREVTARRRTPIFVCCDL